MTEKTIGLTFDGMIAVTDTSNIASETIQKENTDSDDDPDHFSELKWLSQEDFCKSIRNAENGCEIFYNWSLRILKEVCLVFFKFTYLMIFM